MKGVRLLLLFTVVMIGLSGCAVPLGQTEMDETFDSWETVEALGRDHGVSILMWGGNESINQYMDRYVAEALKERYGITLRRVPMSAPEFMHKLLNEKRAGVNSGTADLLWINGENFRTAMQGGLLWGPFTELLPNMKRYYDLKASDVYYDMGIPIEGHQAIWGRAQLVFTYDAALVPDPPKSFAALMEWVQQNPGQFTYPRLPDDFVGAAFIRTAYYELTGQGVLFGQEMEREAFETLSEPVMTYFKALKPHLWRQGRAYPATQAQMDELFKNGEILITMGFEIGKTAGLVARGEYPETVRTFVFDTGTIGNTHYLAIPYNAPNKAGALLTINFLQSPKAQIEKFKPQVWGDMPAFDVNRLNTDMVAALKAIEAGPAFLSAEILAARRLPEMYAVYLDWIKDLWVSEIGGR